MQIFTLGVTFILIDSIYLSLSKNYFLKQVFVVQRGPLIMRIVPTALCYFALIFGLWYFIIREKKSWKEAFLLGLVIYSVYETTNYAIFKNWKFETVIMDSLWGGVLFSLVTKFIYFIEKM
jgi:uncharacterized membrane protein